MVLIRGRIVVVVWDVHVNVVHEFVVAAVAGGGGGGSGSGGVGVGRRELCGDQFV